MKRALSLCKLFTMLATMAVVFSWTPRESAEALSSQNAILSIGVRTPDSCLLLTNRVDFGTYDIASPTADDSQGNIRLNCTPSVVGAIIHIRLGEGNNPAAGSTKANPRRQMIRQVGPGFIRYDLYRNAARTQRWGDTVGSAHFPSAITTFPVDIPVYGRIPALQAAPPGTYDDQVLATVYY